MKNICEIKTPGRPVFLYSNTIVMNWTVVTWHLDCLTFPSNLR